MTFQRDNKVVVKRGNIFIEARIIKIVKPYHGKVYYSPDEVRYFCQIENELSEIYSEINLVNWLKQSSREDNLNKILK
jgi:hypothetical protein